jgi:hypothetical protein
MSMNASPIHKRLGVLVLLGTILAAAGCGSGGGSNGASTGMLSLRITDGPVETAEHVYVQFSGLELHAADGQRTTLYYCQDPADATLTVVSEAACTTPPASKQFDLLALTGGEADFLLEDFTLPAGRYNWIRLMVDTADTLDSYIVVGGVNHELTIPSDAQTGLKLNRGFVVPAGGSADFTIDFDLRKSVHVTGTGEYMLRPTLRLADNTIAGAIAGTIDTLLVPGGCTPAVYVFEGSGVTPDDIDGNVPDPVTTASVKLDNMGVYRYKAAFLEAGDYTVTFTCDAAADDPMVDDTLTFSGTTTVSVTAKTVTVLDF